MFVLRSKFFQAPCHVYAQIYIPMFSFPCLRFDLHVYIQIYVPIPRSMSLCAPCHACVLRSTCQLLCHVLLQPFCPLISLFLVFWPLLVGCRSDPVVQAYIHTPRPISKGLDHFPICMCMFACFYALCLCMPLQIQALPCFVPPVDLPVWLHPSLLGFIWM